MRRCANAFSSLPCLPQHMGAVLLFLLQSKFAEHPAIWLCHPVDPNPQAARPHLEDLVPHLDRPLK